MATITSLEPVDVPAHATAAMLLIGLASKVFPTAMSAKAVGNPQDKTYWAWWHLREVAKSISANGSLLLSPAETRDLLDAMRTVHEDAHCYAVGRPPDTAHCDCATADKVRTIHDLMRAAAGDKKVGRPRASH